MKVSIVCVISLDGYLNPKLEMSPEWSSEADRKFFVDETKRTGAMIMGQNTFKYSFNNKAIPDRLSVIVTHNTAQQLENAWFTDEPPQKILNQLKLKGYDEVSVIGGSMINGLFMNAGLVTDLYITVSPHLFGKGVPLFAGLDKTYDLELFDSKMIAPGEFLNHYKVI